MTTDVYLRPGLTPPTDVELYPSEAGGETTSVDVAVVSAPTAVVARRVSAGRVAAASAVGVASVSFTVHRARSASTTATGAAAVSRRLTLSRRFQAVTAPVVSLERRLDLSRHFQVTTTGAAAVVAVPSGTAPILRGWLVIEPYTSIVDVEQWLATVGVVSELEQLTVLLDSVSLGIEPHTSELVAASTTAVLTVTESRDPLTVAPSNNWVEV